MLTRTIPSSGEELPVIGLGTYRSFDAGLSSAMRGRLAEVLRLFFEAGGTLIDSSPMYGRAEDVVGTLIEETGTRADAFVATKVWTRGRDKGIRDMEASLGKLRCQGIELMQVHNLVDCETHLRTLDAWKAEGKIRYVGITHYAASGFRELGRFLEKFQIDFVQFPYSIAVRKAENYMLPLAADLGVATLINRPFEQDGLFRNVRGQALPEWAGEFGCANWSQFFLKYILAHPAVTCAIPATGDPDHMQDNLPAGQGRMPDEGERKKMIEVIQSL